MKRLLALLLAACVLLAALPAAFAEAAAAPEPEAGLPAVGDVVFGFEAVEIRDFPLVNAQIVRFEHRKTGAELYYVANDDTNRAFDLTFFTDAIDNTGLPHVFEHATLSGSKKYPSAALWFNLSYQCYNTFMNAMTGQRLTYYPVASLSEAQLLKLADFYTDCCFHPMLMADESIYRTEAWRYRMADADADLSIEGTVYSEMQGARTLDRAAHYNNMRAAFPGSLVGNDSGGEPEFIPDMTWDMLRDYHDKYYHPSNCAAYLYGQFEDYTAFLELLDGYFSAYERQEFARADEGYAPIAEPVVQSLPFAVEEGSSTEHAASVYYTFVCPGLNQDTREELVLNTLTDLLVDDASQLQQNLQAAMPYGTFYSYIEEDGPEDAIVFLAENVEAEDAETFKRIVDESLAQVAAEGFPQEHVDGVMASLTISLLLAREQENVGVEGVITNLSGSYASTGDPWNYVDYVEAMGSMDEWNRQGLYTQAVSKWLVDSQTTALVATYPQPGLKEQQDAALAEHLAEVKAAMSEDEIAGIVAASNAEPPEDDASEYVAQLRGVTVESLPEEVKLYEVSDETDARGVRRIDAVAGVDGVGQASVLLDAAGLPQEDIHWFQLYTDLVGELDTAAHTKAELARLMSRYLYDPDVYLSLPREGADGYHPYMRLRWIGLDEDLAAGYDLMRELVFDTRVDDPQKLLEQVQAVKAGLKSEITATPSDVQIRRALGRMSALYAYSAYATGLEYYAFLGEVEQLLADDPDAAVAKLQGIQQYFNNRTNAVTLFAGSADSIALNRPLADAFLDSLESREIERAEYDVPIAARSEALVIDSSVQYNLLVADYAALGLEDFEGELNALTALVSDMILVPQLRDQYGVYSPVNYAIQDAGMYIYAYRDPNIAETYDMLEGLSGQIAALELDQDTLNGYILSSYSEYALSKGELSGAAEATLDALEGRPQGQALEWMRQLKQFTPESVKEKAGLYDLLCENGARNTAGAASAINANADWFDAILNPFGAVDASQVAFADVAEDHPLYAAVRYAFEERLMDPLSEDAFGVDEPATTGDLLTASYALIGGDLDADAALATFAEYGLVPADADLAAPMAPADAWSLFSALVGEDVEPMVETAQPDAATRGELAAMLQAFLAAYE